ncbi:MAG TPA: cysteine desulfurase-like protein [Terriglobales bacterium]|jgi:cysteine desulfurase family protein (TIGR01976 family)|nr:cysteine desulfurase-like protein [Terriglobales bacterium]
MANSNFPILSIRRLFPALNSGDNFIFFDNGAGAQIPQSVLDAVCHHLVSRNVQRGGRYRHSQEVDASIQQARQSVATLLNAREPSEVAFGMNATSFIRLVSLALADILGARKEIIVSDLDHEANIATWLALQSKGVEIRWWNMRKDGTLHVEDLEPLLSSRTRLVACAAASNALGSIVNVKEVARMAHAAGAEVFLDAVHFAPHGVIDVQDWDCDYLVCSGYKIFAPHMGFLWGKREKLEALPTFREDFIPDEIPGKIEVGTFVYENVAGMNAAVGYLEELGRSLTDSHAASPRERLVTAMEAIRVYEATVSAEILRALAELDDVTVYGIQDASQLEHRVPTICFNLNGVPATRVASLCAESGIGVRDGNMYSPRLLHRMGIPPETGAVRASLVHYNTVEEIGKFVDVLRRISPN